MKNTIRNWLFAVASCLALAAMCAIVAVPDAAQAKGKPGGGGGGGGNTEIRLARILFVDSPGIRWDGQPFCVDRTLDEEWDYWDERDPVLALDPDCEPCRIDVSGGGRVKFFTTGRFDRWLALDFREDPDFPHPDPYIDADGNGPNIDAKVYPGTENAPPINDDSFVDNVKTTITLDSMFKMNATRQPLDLTIRAQDDLTSGWAPVGWSLHSIFDLYIVNHPDDGDVRILTTMDPQTGEEDAAFFELWHNGETVGTYYFPLTWEMRIVAAP